MLPGFLVAHHVLEDVADEYHQLIHLLFVVEPASDHSQRPKDQQCYQDVEPDVGLGRQEKDRVRLAQP